MPAERIGKWKAELRSLAGPQATARPYSIASRDRAAQLHLWIGESAFATDQDPGTAIWHFRQAQIATDPSSSFYGRAAFDVAVVEFRRGAFTRSVNDFRSLIEKAARGKVHGIDRVAGALYLRHAIACAGYHAAHAAMGIPEPDELDPLCGISSIAVCLKQNGLPYGKQDVLSKCPVTGMGNTISDLLHACEKMGSIRARLLTMDDPGLRAVPKPLIAYVEHDHFVAITAADASGVHYSCSDCGKWPGGDVHLSWKQFDSIESTLYVSVVCKDSYGDSILSKSFEKSTADPVRAQATAPAIQVASSGTNGHSVNVQSVAREARRLQEIAAHCQITQLPSNSITGVCGSSFFSLHCPGIFQQCAMDASGPSSCGCGGYGPTSGEPVNLATLEEEYTPAPDLVVYNPNGPSVVWQRIYNSLRSGVESNGWVPMVDPWVEPTVGPFNGSGTVIDYFGFGRGWSTSYDSYIALPPGVSGASTSAFEGSLVLPNKAAVRFTVAAHSVPGAIPACNTASNVGCKIQVLATSPALVMAVTYKDGSQWTYTDLGNLPSDPWIEPTLTLTKMQDSTGQWINFNWSGNNPHVLTSITDDQNNPLLAVNQGISPSGYSISRVTDVPGQRVVNYTFGQYNVTPPLYSESELATVSTICATTASAPYPTRYSYGYTVEPNANSEGESLPFLTSISVPSPVGDGSMSTATIHYNSSLFVTSTVDANGNTHSYSSSPGSYATTVTCKNPAGHVDSTYTVNYGQSMQTTSTVDSYGATVAAYQYSDPNYSYLPSKVTVTSNSSVNTYQGSGNPYVYGYSYDSFGNVLTATGPTGSASVTSSYTYTVPGFPCGRLQSTQLTGWPSPCNSSYDAQGNLAQQFFLSPSNQGASSNQDYVKIATDALGNITSVESPGPNVNTDNTTGRVTNSASFTYDPWGPTSQTEAVGEPIALTDPLGHLTHIRYDALGNVTGTWDVIGQQYHGFIYNTAIPTSIRAAR